MGSDSASLVYAKFSNVCILYTTLVCVCPASDTTHRSYSDCINSYSTSSQFLSPMPVAQFIG